MPKSPSNPWTITRRVRMGRAMLLLVAALVSLGTLAGCSTDAPAPVAPAASNANRNHGQGD